MKVIFAQGNPGREYAATRHNVGFQAMEVFATHHGASFTPRPKFFADIAEFTAGVEKVLLVQPTTFYNETGKSARAIIDFYKFDAASDLLVAHDDLALPFGMLRIREKGSDAGNNGIKSLNSHVGPSYQRLRIGVYNELRDRINDADFVLARFTKDEQTALENEILPRCAELFDDFITGGLKTTSHKVLGA